MRINQILELSMLLDNEHFQKVLDWASTKSGYWGELGEGYIDLSMAEKRIKVTYRDSRYKRRCG